MKNNPKNMNFGPPSGFTLVEILIAAVIMGIAVVGVMSAYTTGIRFVYYSRYRLDAASYAQSVLECFRQQVRADTWDTTGDLRFGVDMNCPGPNPLPAFLGATCRYTVTDINGTNIPDLPRRVDITVRWTTP